MEVKITDRQIVERQKTILANLLTIKELLRCDDRHEALYVLSNSITSLWQEYRRLDGIRNEMRQTQ